MFKTRFISGIFLVIGAFASLYFGGYLLAGVLLLLSMGAFYELTKALNVKKDNQKNAMTFFGYCAILAYYLLMAFSDNYIFLVLVATLAIILFLSIYVFSFPKYNVEDTMGAIFSYIYAPIMLSFIYLTRTLPDGNHIVWMILASSWGYDTCAYCVGMLTGKTIGNHKFLPKLSPKKSIEGVIGGVVGAGALGLLYGHLFMPNAKWMFAAIAAIGGIIAQIGDLAASAIKRNKDIKDYGKCIPGHGGIMDRFDSVIFTAPITYVLAVLWIVAGK